MLLVYDHKCNICRNLAYKIHIATKKQVEIKALSDPETAEVLKKFYPDGWSHDFYIVDNGACRKGMRGLTRLMKSLGVKGMAELLSEYSAFKIAKSAHAATTNGHQPSRRTMMKYAALAPVMAGLSKFSLADPFKSSAGDFSVHIAQVTEGSSDDEWVSNAWRCDQCLGTTPKFGQGNMDTKQSSVDTILADTRTPLLFDGHASANLKVIKKVLTTETVKDGVPLHRVMDIYSVLLDHPRFNITFNVGNGPVTSPTRGAEVGTTIAVMINHDLPIPNIDFIAIENNDYVYNTAKYPYAYRSGIQALADIHGKGSGNALARVYKGIADSMDIMKAELEKAVPDTLMPIHSKVVITSLPELMKFTTIPSTVNFGATVGGCDCTLTCCCGCGTCLGCGCSIGLCFPPVPCFCNACVGCGCGCGACCGCSLC
jgi:hypothetical protein